MITSAQKARLGVFIVVSIALLLGTMGVLMGIQITEKRDVYTIRYTQSLSGLEPGAPVKYNGVRVGSVDSVKIDPVKVDQVVVTVSLDEGTPIKFDTKAVVNLTGITGLKFIELSGGTSESAYVSPGSEIQAGESLLDRLTGEAEDIAEKAELLLNQLNRFTDDEHRDKVFKAVADIDALVVSTRETIDENRQNVLAITTNAKSISTDIDASLKRVENEAILALKAVRQLAEGLRDNVDKKKIGQIVANIDSVVANLKVAVQQADVPDMALRFKELVSISRNTIRNIDVTVLRGREDIYESLAYLLETLENLSEFSRLIREDPSLLLGGSEEQERKLP